MVLAITGFLVAVGTVVFLVLEWNNPATLQSLGLPGKLLAGLFQSVTPRTAGFNTLDYSRMETPSILFTALLMFIGGNPGSTAGGHQDSHFLCARSQRLERGAGPGGA